MELYGNEHLLVAGIIFLAALTQSITGFGFAIVSMSFLPGVIGLQTAVPLVTLVGIIANIVIWYHYRRNCSLKAVKKLAIAALIATPVGTLLLDRIPEAIALKGLGILIISYVLYDWLDLSLPRLKSSIWAYIFGGASGILNGAYTVGGPPVIVYANCRGWTPKEFKGNLTAIFFFSSLIAAIAHGWQGNITISVGRFAVYSLPGFALGLWLGIILSTKINPLTFKRITLALLMVTGLRLLV
ncbi:sulfite exporter TauE/SafE family protein [Pleurocapsa sp. FMAR1]|uniref:sulfite exporter TauE/SafE family protein n=1 Tax=Pleurocapsa sp. FMAR1 TaxID=3040204 RepID=UPI0029C6ED2D|nr:sulfite exporter TauE/SafE family protein [Pleurocapsa sp. FMAR1]